MLLHIDDHMTIEEIQDHFNECYPFLKICFYSKAQKRHKPANKAEMLDEKSKVGVIRKNHTNGIVEIMSWYTIGQVERELKEKFDLNTQIFRWDNISMSWVPTFLTEGLTIQQQSKFSAIPPLACA